MEDVTEITYEAFEDILDGFEQIITTKITSKDDMQQKSAEIAFSYASLASMLDDQVIDRVNPLSVCLLLTHLSKMSDGKDRDRILKNMTKYQRMLELQFQGIMIFHYTKKLCDYLLELEALPPDEVGQWLPVPIEPIAKLAKNKIVLTDMTTDTVENIEKLIPEFRSDASLQEMSKAAGEMLGSVVLYNNQLAMSMNAIISTLLNHKIESNN